MTRLGMLRRLRPHLSYANVMASLALFFALGGVGYAAAKLPRNSVGAPQIVRNAVTGAKVKDGSLTAKDFSSTLLSSLRSANKAAAGVPGPKGDAGAKGDTGAKGDAGTAGATGTAGADGETGPKGDTGPRGVAAWDTLPAGQAVTGAFEYDGVGSIGGDYRTYVKLPAQAPCAAERVDRELRAGRIGGHHG